MTTTAPTLTTDRPLDELAAGRGFSRLRPGYRGQGRLPERSTATSCPGSVIVADAIACRPACKEYDMALAIRGRRAQREAVSGLG